MAKCRIPKNSVQVIESASVAHVGIETARGAHVTPQAFAFVDGNIWLVASRKSLKVRVLQKKPEVGLMMRGPDASVTLTGRAKVLWAESAADAISMVGASAWLPAMAGSYATRNWRLMLGLGADVLERPTALPYDRVVIRVSPARGAHSEAGALVSTFGDWTPFGDNAGSDPQGRVELPAAVPARPASLLCQHGPCSLAVVTDAGPLVLSAEWDDGIQLPRGLTRALGVPPLAPGALTWDTSTGNRPSRFFGLMLRGSGRRSADSLTLSTERATWWDGFAAGTVTVTAPQ
jgi:general stress protein 26